MPQWFYVPASAGLLLDNYLSALSTGFAVGLERLLSSYTGYCMRVERESDGVIVDVAFDTSLAAPALSLSSAITIVSGSTNAANLGQFMKSAGFTNPDGKSSPQRARLLIWYDQINGNHFTQNTAGKKPIIVWEGALLDGAYFDGSAFYMTGMTTAIGTSNITVYTEFLPEDVTKQCAIWSKRLDAPTYNQISLFTNETATNSKLAYGLVYNTTNYRDITGDAVLSNLTKYKSKVKRVGTAFETWLDGSPDGSAVCGSTYNISNTTAWTLGKLSNATGLYFKGSIKTMICGYSNFDITGAGY